MANRLRSPCAEPGCGALTRNSRCDRHAQSHQRSYDARRGSSHQRGYTHRWAKYSRHYRDQHPLCAHCKEGNRRVPAEHVDHIVPVSGPDDPRFWDPTNHQGLCAACHNVKTAKERARC